MKQIDKDELLELFNNGNESAFEKVYNINYGLLCYFVDKIIRDFDISKDIVQEIFIKLWHDRLTFNSYNSLQSYLIICAKTKSFNHIKNESNRQNIRNQLLISDQQAQLFEIESHILNKIFTAIDELPPECGKIFRLSYIDQLEVKKICEMLQISASTVMTQRQRAKKILFLKLEHLYKHIIYLF